jgi:hypothetical protein
MITLIKVLMIGSAKLSKPLGLQTQLPSYFIMISIFWHQMVGEQRSLTWFMRQSRILQKEEMTAQLMESEFKAILISISVMNLWNPQEKTSKDMLISVLSFI